MRRWRYGLCTAGIALMLFGAIQIVTAVPIAALVVLAVWLLAAVVIHDGVLSPFVLGVGWVVARVVPPRARRYLQGAFIAGGLVTVIAVPLILRRGSQPRSKAILQRDYAGNLTILLALIATAALLAYAVHVARDHQRDRQDG